MKRQMLINATLSEELRIAVIEDGRLEELYIERGHAEQIVGNIYRGRITHIEPTLQAAFVDYGAEKNGFLHVSDVVSSLIPPEAKKQSRGRARRSGERPPIQTIFRKGDPVVVQVTKEGIAKKGAGLTTFLSIPGRYLVLMSGLRRTGVSRKIPDEAVREQLRKALNEMDAPKDVGVIARTAGVGLNKRELERDLRYLSRLWETVKKRGKKAELPSAIYKETDFVIRIVRDVFTADTSEVIVDDENVRKRVMDFMNIVMPRYRSRAKLHTAKLPIFHHYKIEDQIQTVYGRSVALPQGGSIVIEPTEALVSIDVNSGTFRSGNDPEETAYKLNLNAADEIARQLRLRDLGGVIVIDFVDMKKPAHLRGLEKALAQAIKRDRARTDIARLSKFCLAQMTRQRMRSSVQKALFEECPSCGGRGHRKTVRAVAAEALRRLRMLEEPRSGDAITLRLHPEVAGYMQNAFRTQIAQLEERVGCRIVVKGDRDFPFDSAEIVD